MFFGSQIDLSAKIKSNLFLLCPNNSGSTYLSKAISTSRHVWSLPREGQHVHGFMGPSTRALQPLLWNAIEPVRQQFRDPAAYDWAKIQKAWYFQAMANHADASVFLTKAPPFLLIPDQLQQAFANSKFLFMVRDPFATAEGILRRRDNLGVPLDAVVDLCALHLIRCFEQQRHNIDRYGSISCAFTYEELCADPSSIKSLIQRRVPSLDDLNLEQELSVKGMYSLPLTNLNQEQIDRLDPDEHDTLRKAFLPYSELFASFGYRV